jgi:pimeloyl-ACP methyl ester carboxylesterase
MNVVLVHGAWADGSSWSAVIEALHARGHRAYAVQLPMTSLEADIDATRRAIDKIGATVVVGHSYGGFVITAAAAEMPTVQSLVFVAAYAPIHGETIASISHAAAQMPGGRAIIYGDDGWTSVDPDQFGSALGADLSLDTQKVLAAVQGPTHVSCLITPIDADIAWPKLPCHYVVSTDDQILDPALQQAFAARIDARVTEVAGSHLALLSHPTAVADAIEATMNAPVPSTSPRTAPLTPARKGHLHDGL